MRTIFMLAIVLIASTLATAQDSIIPTPSATVDQLRALVAKLEAENQALRDQLRERDADKSPTPAVLEKGMPLPPAPGWKVTVETITNCPACDLFKSRDSPQLVRNKWVVESELIITAPPGMRFPRWRVCGPNAEDGCFTIEFTTDFAGKLREVVRKAKSETKK